MRAFFIALAVSLLAVSSGTAAEPLTIVFTGDILLDRGVRTVIEKHGADHLFTREVDSVLRHAHVAVGNLECPATKIHAPRQKLYIFRSEPEWLTTLQRHGFTHLNLANNHSVDQGRNGLTDTRRNIIAAKMVPVGAGQNMAEASQPVLLATAPRKVWLLTSLRLALENYAYLPQRPSVSQEPMDTLLWRIRKLKAEDPSAIVLVSLHWGAEHTLKPVPSQRWDAHRLIAAGADALVCHHTHTLQTTEHYRGKPIYYSIGNFIFDQQKPLNSKAAMVQIDITADSISSKAIPIEIRRCVPAISRHKTYRSHETHGSHKSYKTHKSHNP